MVAITWYSFFRFLHVTCAILAIGPHFVLALMVKHMGKNPESVPTVWPLLEKAGLFPGIGGPLMLVTGLLMIAFSGSGWNAFGQLWLTGSLAIFVFAVIWIRFRIDPAFKAMLAAIQGGPIKPEEVRVLSDRVNAALNVHSVAFMVIIILMILKPTL